MSGWEEITFSDGKTNQNGADLWQKESECRKLKFVTGYGVALTVGVLCPYLEHAGGSLHGWGPSQCTRVSSWCFPWDTKGWELLYPRFLETSHAALNLSCTVGMRTVWTPCEKGSSRHLGICPFLSPPRGRVEAACCHWGWEKNFRRPHGRFHPCLLMLGGHSDQYLM